jgi:hypothetical protein
MKYILRAERMTHRKLLFHFHNHYTFLLNLINHYIIIFFNSLIPKYRDINNKVKIQQPKINKNRRTRFPKFSYIIIQWV